MGFSTMALKITFLQRLLPTLIKLNKLIKVFKITKKVWSRLELNLYGQSWEPLLYMYKSTEVVYYKPHTFGCSDLVEHWCWLYVSSWGTSQWATEQNRCISLHPDPSSSPTSAFWRAKSSPLPWYKIHKHRGYREVKSKIGTTWKIWCKKR